MALASSPALNSISNPLFIKNPMVGSLPVDAIKAASEAYPKPASDYAYGTAGFRTKAALLPCALFRIALLAVLRSQKVGGKVIGVMITASHNPAADNGVKLIDPRGEMLEASWETYATKVCNSASSGELVEVLQHLVQSLHIDLSVKPRVIFGRDTRPSGEELSTALAKGLGAMGLSEETIGYGKGEQAGTSDKGVVTTPILHYLVRCENTVGKGELEAYGTPTIQGYYEKMANAFKKLTDSKAPFPSPLKVDCANGVGAPILEQFSEVLSRTTAKPSNGNSSPRPPPLVLVPVATAISDPALLNAQSGADFVKTQQKLPPVFVAPSEHALDSGTLACSFDGDADRIIFYYLDASGAFKLLDGDKQAALSAGFLVDLVQQAGLNSREDGEGGVDVGVVQTAYANGSSTKYLQERLPVACVPTGVKHLHHAAERYDIGVYFEANGHGTVLFSPEFTQLLSTYQPKTPAQKTALSHLAQFTKLINQTVGDSLSDLLLMVAILIHRGWGPAEWDASYFDLPNRLVKVHVKDRNAFTTTDAERRLVKPAGVQALIDEEVKKYDSGRAFVRPSGTEDCVRVYAEAASKSHVEELALRVAQIVEDNA